MLSFISQAIHDLYSKSLHALKRVTKSISSTAHSYEALKKDDDLELLDIESQAETKAPDISVWQAISQFNAITFSKENHPQVFTAALLTLIEIGLNLSSPYLASETYRLLSTEEDTTTLAGVELKQEALIGLLITAYTLSRILPNFRDQVMTALSLHNAEKVIELCAGHLLKKSLNYHVNTSSSEHIVLFQKGFSIPNVGNPLLTSIAPTLIETSIASVLLSQQYGTKVGTSLLGLLILYATYSYQLVPPIVKAKEESLAKGNEGWQHLDGAIKQYKVMRDFNQLDYTMKKIHDAQNAFIQSETRASNLPSKINLGHILLAKAYMLALSLHVAMNIKNGTYTVQSFITLVGYLKQLSDALPQFGASINSMVAAYPDLKFVFSELQKGPEVIDEHPEQLLSMPSNQAPRIVFNQVAFNYPGKAPVFENMSFVIEPGQTVALVSESGVGKTTLFNLLYG
jgi:ABC-type multidrug transport system fused ATPase/permease subunit